MKIFIFGFGQVSKELAKKLSNEKNINFKIISRNTENYLDYEFLKIDFFKNKLNLSDSILISTVPPNEKDEDYILKNKDTCISKIDELKVRKYTIKSSYPIINSLLFLIILFGIFITQIRKE